MGGHVNDPRAYGMGNIQTEAGKPWHAEQDVWAWAGSLQQTACNSSPPPEPGVTSKLHQVEKAVGHQSEMLQILTERLKPILSQRPGSPDKERANVVITCPLIERLDSLRDTIARQTQAVELILQSLEI